MKHKKHKTRRRSRGLSAGRKTSRRRRRGLHDGVLSGANLKESFMTSLFGGAGGGGAYLADKALVGFKLGGLGRALVAIGGGAAVAAFGAPKMGAGFSGGLMALNLKQGLGDDDNTEFADDDVLEEGEIYETQDGNYVRMLNDGTIEPLSDEEVQSLHDGVNPYPAYSIQHNM